MFDTLFGSKRIPNSCSLNVSHGRPEQNTPAHLAPGTGGMLPRVTGTGHHAGRRGYEPEGHDRTGCGQVVLKERQDAHCPPSRHFVQQSDWLTEDESFIVWNVD